jgi:hypothetical protein
VVWSNRDGPIQNIGTVSPAYLPSILLEEAGIKHPYYTGVLSEMRKHFPVVDRHVLMGADGSETADWSRAKEIAPDVSRLRLLQYDAMFGKKFGTDRFFPKPRQDVLPLG